MSKNTKVMRLYEKEVELVEFLRKNGTESLIHLLKEMFEEEKVKQNRKFRNTVKTYLHLLDDKEVSNKLSWDNDYLTEKQQTLVQKAIVENRNIIIIGEIGIGKTLLLKKILMWEGVLFPDRRLLVVESHMSEIKNPQLVRKDVDFREISKVTVQDITTCFSKETSRLVVGEMNTKAEIFTAISGLQAKRSLLTTVQAKNWKEKIKSHSNLENIPFVVIEIGLNSQNKRLISDVYEDVL